MVDTTKETYAEDIEAGDELDFDNDEYADNEQAMFSFALVLAKHEWYDPGTKDPWVSLETSQGVFDMPAGHLVKLKVTE